MSVSTKVDVKKESVVVQKTERFVVKERTDISKNATAALNYKIAVAAPNGSGTITESKVSSFRQPLFGQGPPQPIEVRNVPVKKKN